MTLAAFLAFCAALWQHLWDDQPERVTQQELYDAHLDCQQADKLERYAMACTRVQDYQRWRVRFREAEHERAIQSFRRRWDGCIG